MVVAMGLVGADGTLLQGYNVTNCEWDGPNNFYRIALTGTSYHWDYFVTIVTPAIPGRQATFAHDMQSFELIVDIWDTSNNLTTGPFSFMVLDTTP
jgi:hypothetical protein